MINKWIKTLSYLSMSAAPLFGVLHVEDAYKIEKKETKHSDKCCDNCCPPREFCAECAQLWPTCGPDYIITPNAGPCTAGGCDLFITAEFIYWTARQDNMGFAFVDVSPDHATANGLASPSTPRGQIIEPDWRMAPGFKVGLGWVGCCDGWDLYLNYTWLRPRSKREYAVPNVNRGQIVNDLGWLTQASGTIGHGFESIEEMNARWKLNFNALDLELGRNFFISQCLYLRPHFGFKGLWNRQKLDVHAEGHLDNSSVVIDLLATGRYRMDRWGFGIRTGIDTAWHFTPCFSLVGETAASLLWGQFCSTIKEYNFDIEDGFFTLFNNVRNDFHTMKPLLEFFAGVRFEDWFCCDRYHLGLDLGWEVQWVSNENQYFLSDPVVMISNGSNRSRLIEARMGDLYFQGLTVRFRFDF